MLAEYKGTVLLISHDRDFLDRLVSGVIAPEGDGRWLEYAGGYSDMLAQRGADLARRERRPDARKATREPASRIAVPGTAKRRLAFKDKHALETLPQTIATLQTEAGALQARLEEPGFYARDRTGFEQATATLGELQRKIAAAENRWLELEMLREEIAGVGDPA
jgi:ATP-binding cassette subfamily F protein uup